MEFFPVDHYHRLNRFANLVWGNVQAVLRLADPLGVEYIDLTGYFDALRFVFGSALTHDKILVRDEYHTALRELRTDLYRRGAYVTGQSGIGKSLFLIYLLVELLGEQHMVAVQFMVGDKQVYAIFGGTFRCHYLHDIESLCNSHVTWALSDSNDQNRTPSGIFYSSTDRIRTIQTTSPREDRWRNWSKEAGARCYVMDIWTEPEIANLAILLNFDVERMAALAETWGGVPRKLLEFLPLPEQEIEDNYREDAVVAIQKCRDAIFSAAKCNLIEESLSNFFFCRPKRMETGIVRRRARAYVPTLTLRSLLGEALQMQDNFVKRDFFRALDQSNETRQSAGYIFESWFHSYFIAAKSLKCHWVQGSELASSITGTTEVVPTTWAVFNIQVPPFYWIAPENFPGVDSVLVLDEEIYAFRVIISPKLKSPIGGLQMVRDHLPARLKHVAWRVVFVGDDGSAVQAVANHWVGKLFFPTGDTILPIAWAEVDPVANGVSWKAYKDEALSDEAMME